MPRPCSLAKAVLGVWPWGVVAQVLDGAAVQASGSGQHVGKLLAAHRVLVAQLRLSSALGLKSRRP